MRATFPAFGVARPLGGAIVLLGLAAGAMATDAPLSHSLDRATPAPLTVADRLGFKFDPPTAKAATPPGPLTIDAAPGVMLLPRMRVSSRPVDLVEHDVLTQKGQTAVAVQRYTTPLYRATIGPMAQAAAYYFNPLALLGGWHPNQGEAMTLYREDERVKLLSELDDLMDLETLGTGKNTDAMKRLKREARSVGIDALYWNPSILSRR